MKSRGVAVVTGASAGVGRATAVECGARGFDVALLARGETGLEHAAQDVERHGARALCVPTDVSQYDAVDHAATTIEAELGPIAVWVNNAMTTIFAPVSDIEPDDFRRAMDVTFLGQVWGTMAALQRMRPRDAGTIVNVGSALAFIGIPLQSAHCSAKFASRGFVESTRAELLHEGSNIRLCMVHLPAVNTPQFDWCKTTMGDHPQPVAPIYQPETPAGSSSMSRSTVVGARSSDRGTSFWSAPRTSGRASTISTPDRRTEYSRERQCRPPRTAHLAHSPRRWDGPSSAAIGD